MITPKDLRRHKEMERKETKVKKTNNRKRETIKCYRAK